MVANTKHAHVPGLYIKNTSHFWLHGWNWKQRALWHKNLRRKLMPNFNFKKTSKKDYSLDLLWALWLTLLCYILKLSRCGFSAQHSIFFSFLFQLWPAVPMVPFYQKYAIICHLIALSKQSFYWESYPSVITVKSHLSHTMLILLACLQYM